MASVIDFLLGRRVVLKRDDRVPTSEFDQVVFERALAQLDAVPAHKVIGVGQGLSIECLPYGYDRRMSARHAMAAHSDAAWILSLDGDGYIREAALKRLANPPTSVGRMVALALRLNDWVPQVRAAAVETFQRLLPVTSAECLASSAPYFLKQRFVWKRWDFEAAIFDEAFQRSDVAAAMLQMFLRGRVGALGTTLRLAMRFPVFDVNLEALATEARLASVRAVALKSLLRGTAEWVVGYKWVWLDKAYGRRRQVAEIESRQLTVPASNDLLVRGLGDRAANVRKIAADALIDRIDSVPNVRDLAERLAKDKSPAVRERADYLLRHLV